MGDSNGKKRPFLPLMTPRNLSSATPLRFNQHQPSSSNTLNTNKASKETKSDDESKTKGSSDGYVDRAAQRRLGFDQAVSFSEIKLATKLSLNSDDSTEREAKAKAKAFLEDSSSDFPACNSEWVERAINFVLRGGFLGENEPNANLKGVKSQFKANEAFLQFKSIEEYKTHPFDPYSRPRKVFRASARLKDSKNEYEEDSEVIARVKEAFMRLETVSERNKKYLKVLKAKNGNNADSDDDEDDEKEELNDSNDIFPDAGRFDESAFILNSLSKPKEEVPRSSNSKSESAKSKLFSKSKSKPVQAADSKDEEVVDVFELIAKKSLDGEGGSVKTEDFSGGIFGFSGFLPKLSRLESEEKSKALTSSALSGAYASILSDEEATGPSKQFVDNDEAEEEYLVAFDSDEEGEAEGVEDLRGKGPSKRKLARKEDKEASKVEKLVKSKFGVDLSK